MNYIVEGVQTHPRVRALAFHFPWRRLLLGCLATLVIALIATAKGSVDIPLGAVASILLSKIPGVNIEGSWAPGWETIVWQVRVPRVLLAGLVGGALSLSGATYQGLFRNPLADPYLLGIAGGAGLGATLILISPLQASMYTVSALPFVAFAGALAAAAVAYLVARVGKTVPMTTLVLAGVAIAALTSAITSFLLMASREDIRVIFAWLLGGFSTSNWDKMPLLIPYLIPSAVFILLHGRILNVMQLDEEQAHQLGVPVERTKLLLLGAASLATAAAVSVSGLIGFVGLVVPHAIRLVWGPDHRFLLPGSLVLGGGFLILADLVARSIVSPAEMPVGIITAFCGSPFFLYLLRQRKRAVF